MRRFLPIPPVLFACPLLVGCDSLLDPFRSDPYPIHIEWVTTDSAGDWVLTSPDSEIAPLVRAAANRWARILAPTPVARGSHTLERRDTWWPAGHEVKYGLTIAIELGANCGGGAACASGGGIWEKNPNVIQGWVGVAAGIHGLDAKGRKQWEGVFVHEIGHILMWDYSVESEYVHGYLHRWITEPRVLRVWRQHFDGEGYPLLSFDGITDHLKTCTAIGRGEISDVMTDIGSSQYPKYAADGSYRLTKLSASMVAPIYTVDLDAADSFTAGCAHLPEAT